jgi:hypothetical protein
MQDFIGSVRTILTRIFRAIRNFLVSSWRIDWVRWLCGQTAIAMILLLLVGWFYNSPIILTSGYFPTSIGAYLIGMFGMYISIQSTRRARGINKWVLFGIITIISYQLGMVVVQNMLRMFSHNAIFYQFGFVAGMIGYHIEKQIFPRRRNRP